MRRQKPIKAQDLHGLLSASIAYLTKNRDNKKQKTLKNLHITNSKPEKAQIK